MYKENKLIKELLKLSLSNNQSEKDFSCIDESEIIKEEKVIQSNSINSVSLVTLFNGIKFIIKEFSLLSKKESLSILRNEYNGLKVIKEVTEKIREKEKDFSLKVPEPLALIKTEMTNYLVIEYIEPKMNDLITKKHWEVFGQNLAIFHELSGGISISIQREKEKLLQKEKPYGFFYNNYISITPQSNKQYSKMD